MTLEPRRNKGRGVNAQHLTIFPLTTTKIQTSHGKGTVIQLLQHEAHYTALEL